MFAAVKHNSQAPPVTRFTTSLMYITLQCIRAIGIDSTQCQISNVSRSVCRSWCHPPGYPCIEGDFICMPLPMIMPGSGTACERPSGKAWVMVSTASQKCDGVSKAAHSLVQQLSV